MTADLPFRENTLLVLGNKPGIICVESWQKAAAPAKIMQENKKIAFDFILPFVCM
jgi:hypothetical protein